MGRKRDMADGTMRLPPGPPAAPSPAILARNLPPGDLSVDLAARGFRDALVKLMNVAVPGSPARGFSAGRRIFVWTS
jgi:hypothetical protein